MGIMRTLHDLRAARLRRREQLVDEVGLVRCPERGMDVEVELCMACPRLRAATYDEDRIVTIVCTRGGVLAETMLPVA